MWLSLVRASYWVIWVIPKYLEEGSDPSASANHPQSSDIPSLSWLSRSEFEIASSLVLEPGIFNFNLKLFSWFPDQSKSYI